MTDHPLDLDEVTPDAPAQDDDGDPDRYTGGPVDPARADD